MQSFVEFIILQSDLGMLIEIIVIASYSSIYKLTFRMGNIIKYSLSKHRWLRDMDTF